MVPRPSSPLPARRPGRGEGVVAVPVLLLRDRILRLLDGRTPLSEFIAWLEIAAPAEEKRLQRLIRQAREGRLDEDEVYLSLLRLASELGEEIEEMAA